MVKKRSEKKGALSLSMDTIVVLILAIVLIGLGLGLIRNIFSSAEAKVRTTVATHEVINPPTRDSPLTLNPPLIEVKPNQPGETNIAFMNTQPDIKKYSLEIIDTDGNICNANDPGDLCPGDIIYSLDKVSIKPGDVSTWRVVIRPAAADLSGTIRLFTAKVVCDPLDCAETTEFQKNIDFRVQV